jgi:hypothetical protein
MLVETEKDRSLSDGEATTGMAGMNGLGKFGAMGRDGCWVGRGRGLGAGDGGSGGLVGRGSSLVVSDGSKRRNLITVSRVRRRLRLAAIW